MLLFFAHLDLKAIKLWRLSGEILQILQVGMEIRMYNDPSMYRGDKVIIWTDKSIHAVFWGCVMFWKRKMY